jgi:hypothetical protein
LIFEAKLVRNQRKKDFKASISLLLKSPPKEVFFVAVSNGTKKLSEIILIELKSRADREFGAQSEGISMQRMKNAAKKSTLRVLRVELSMQFYVITNEQKNFFLPKTKRNLLFPSRLA